MHKIDDCIRRHGVAQALAIAHLVSIDKCRHVMAKLALVIEHVAARLLMLAEITFKHLGQRGAFDLARRARYVALDVLGKSQ